MIPRGGICVIAGVLLCPAGKAELSAGVGTGTVITAFFTGPLIVFFNRKLPVPFPNQP